MTATAVLVHGAWHGAWCWEDVKGAIEEEGFRVLNVDLPGHWAAGSKNRKWSTFASYVEHACLAVDSIDGPVVLVGHSMGGLVTQRLLEDLDVAKAMLVASVPRRGALGVTLRLARSHPKLMAQANLTLSMWPFVSTQELVRQHFFGTDTSDEVVASAAEKMQNESYVAYLSMIARPPRPNAVSSPVEVIAAKDDAIFTLEEQHDLARAYGHEQATVLSGAHDLMLEPVWPELAGLIVESLREVNA